MGMRITRDSDLPHIQSNMYALMASVVPLSVITTGLGNGADQTEDVLATYSLPANSFGAKGIQGLYIQAWGHCATNGDTKQMNLYFGTAEMSTPAAATSNKNWYLELTVFRTAASVFTVLGQGDVDLTAVTPFRSIALAATETAAIIIKCTGQDTSANTANAIVCDLMLVQSYEQSTS